MATPEDNCQSMTTLVLPTGSPNHTSSSIQNKMSNHMERKSEYKEYVAHNSLKFKKHYISFIQ